MLNKKHIFSCLVVLVIISFIVEANMDYISDKNTLYLKSRVYVPEDGVNDQLRLYIRNRGYISSKSHILIQFNKTPDKQIREYLNDNDINLLSYIPNNAWYVSIPHNKLNNLSTKSFIHSIDLIQPNDKVSPYIREGKFFSWAFDDHNRMLLIVKFFDDIQLRYGEEIITGYNGVVYNKLESINSLVARVNINTIYQLSNEDEIQWVEQIPPLPEDELDQSTSLIGVNVLQNSPYELDGSNINVLIYDSGEVQSHTDFNGRLTMGENSAISNHATYVAGIVGGNGSVNNSYSGIAKKVEIISYDNSGYGYNNTGDIKDEYNESINYYNTSIASNSWGHPVSSIVHGGGNPTIYCPRMGDYTMVSKLFDEIVRGNLTKPISIVFSGGNERDYVECGNNYSTTNPPKPAKNIIVVGAINSNNDSMTNFSSWGPVDDGRLRPDIVAPGCEGILKPGGWYNDPSKSIWSTYPTNTYYGGCGTSAAAPHVSGTAALMLQQYRCTLGTDDNPLPSTVKALLIHTAKDLNNTGPDYTTGYGRINATEAVDYVIYKYFREDSLEQANERDEWNFTVYNMSELKVSLVWDDYPGTPNADPALVNDLDLTLEAPNGTLYYPWTLDSVNPSHNAVRNASNHIDNVEQVVVDNPDDGNWTIIVNATILPKPSQNYSLVYKRGYEIDVLAGWNLISFPVTLYGNRNRVMDVFSDTEINRTGAGAYIVYYYNASVQLWGSLASYDVLVPGRGYAIKMNEDDTIIFEGNPATDSIEMADDEWNLVGYNSYIAQPVGEAVENVDLFSLDFSPLDPPHHEMYYSPQNLSISDRFNMSPGYGYWFNMSNADTFSFNPQRSCVTPVTRTMNIYTGADTPLRPYMVYGYAHMNGVLNDSNRTVTVDLRINGSVVSNYTMGDIANSTYYRLLVPLYENASTGDEAFVYINNSPTLEGSISIGEEDIVEKLNFSAVNVFINVKTLKDEYGENEFVNLTDPPNPDDIMGPDYLITRDTAWTVLSQSYITKFMDFDFIYVNDSFYRVDWQWTSWHVRDLLRNCSLVRANQRVSCASEISQRLLPGFNPAQLANHVGYLRNNPMPKSVVRGNANLLGDINSFAAHSGSFYVNLVDGFYHSNGLRIRIGFNSTLAEFNNSMTSEKFYYRLNDEKEIVRYLRLKDDSDIVSATITLTGGYGPIYKRIYSNSTDSMRDCAPGDLNDDGRPDLMCTPDPGIDAWRSIGTNSSPNFVLDANLKTGLPNGLGCGSGDDVVAFADLDADSDLDIIMACYDSNVSMFKNAGAVDSPNFAETAEWGLYRNYLFNGQSCPSNALAYMRSSFVDIDDDNDFDLYMNGDQDSGITYAFENKGNQSNASFGNNCSNINTSLNLPAWDDGSTRKNHPAAFIDLDLDGDFDAIRGSGDAGAPQGAKVWENNGTALVPLWVYRSEWDLDQNDDYSNAIGSTLQRPSNADFTGDGVDDILLSKGLSSGHNYIIELNHSAPHDLTIDAGNDTLIDYNSSGIFNISLDYVDLNVSAINDYLAGCTPDPDGYCTVPVIFDFDMTGTLAYSNITVQYSSLPELNQSKLVINTTSQVYLNMKVQYFNATTDTWVDEAEILSDSDPRTVVTGTKFDALWNPVGWNTSTRQNGDGLYRAYVASTDRYGRVMVSKTGSDILDTYEFVIGNTTPKIESVSATNPRGFGENVTVTANITKVGYGIDTVLVGITPSGLSETNYSMWNISSHIWTLNNFTSYMNGTYDFTVYVNNTVGNSTFNSSSFEMYADVSSYVKTVKTSYLEGEMVYTT